MNKHLRPPQVDDKQKEPKLTPCMKAPAKWEIELHQAGLKACHCGEEFTLWWIRPLGRQEKLAFECPQLADPIQDPSAGKILSSFL
jgi:hypothetical protein